MLMMERQVWVMACVLGFLLVLAAAVPATEPTSEQAAAQVVQENVPYTPSTCMAEAMRDKPNTAKLGKPTEKQLERYQEFETFQLVRLVTEHLDSFFMGRRLLAQQFEQRDYALTRSEAASLTQALAATMAVDRDAGVPYIQTRYFAQLVQFLAALYNQPTAPGPLAHSISKLRESTEEALEHLTPAMLEPVRELLDKADALFSEGAFGKSGTTSFRRALLPVDLLPTVKLNAANPTEGSCQASSPKYEGGKEEAM